MIDEELLRYPIGRFRKPDFLTPEERSVCLERLAAVPDTLRQLATGLSETSLNKTYRPGSWTVRQVIHHMGDSHINAYVRLKLTLTEDVPVIKPYLENSWVQLADSSSPVESTFDLLTIIHSRLCLLFGSLRSEEWQRQFFHPESKQHYSLDQLLALYTWHGDHHLGHIKLALTHE